MDTNQETGVSIDDLADLIVDEPEQVEQQETEAEALPAEAEQQAEATDEADELVDAEYEGKTYKVSKEIKEALLRQSDYTRKTQEVAETRKQVEERAQLLEQHERVMLAGFDKAVELREMRNRLTQYEQIDWNALVDADPAQATKLNLAYQQLQREAALKQQEFQQVDYQRQQLSAQQQQQMRAEGKRELARRIPNFNAEVEAKVFGIANEFGYSEAEVRSTPDPRALHVLHELSRTKAELHALKNGAKKGLKKVVEAPAVVKPQAQQPKPRTNQAAADRLKKSGRVEDLAALL